MHCAQTAKDIYRHNFVRQSQIALKFDSHWPIRSSQILPESDPLPVDLSDGDILWQIAAKWLEIAQWSQWRAYMKQLSLFRMALSLTPMTSPSQKSGVPNAPKDQFRDVCCHHLTNSEYDRRYRQDFLCISQPHRAMSTLPNYFCYNQLIIIVYYA